MNMSHAVAPRERNRKHLTPRAQRTSVRAHKAAPVLNVYAYAVDLNGMAYTGTVQAAHKREAYDVAWDALQGVIETLEVAGQEIVRGNMHVDPCRLQ